ncbi:AraC-like DNA-binding protein [Roseiarcus fermentans]|uniref:AraC-like DNA-binding protein n=1 Tax=Roseiarcus fermentans TaxID=1473586 RepID=A0A366EXH2_9HYPH|nr:AraC-like DNA-binding protein [Roseiarcus fermentans]
MTAHRPRPPLVTGNPHRPSFVATRIEAAIADRTWATQSLDGIRCFRAFFLRRGTGSFGTRNGPLLELSAPQVLWTPFAERGEFRLFAGGDGATLLATEDVVWSSIGESRLGAQLRPLIDRTVLAPASRLGSSLAEMEALFDGFERETRDPGPGASAMGSLYLGLLMMHLWRSCGLARESDALDAGAPTAQRFRQLVELRYRDNLGVDDFAQLLGVTRSHLHFACVKALGRPPQRVVHERLVAEARLRLRDTAQPIEQVGYSLGFRDAAYFNRFFRRLSGLTPGDYRRAARTALPAPPTSYTAWP